MKLILNMGRRVESSSDIARAFAKALDHGSRFLGATAVATGAVGGIEIVRHSNTLGLSVPVVEAAQDNCVVSIKVEGDIGATNEFTNIHNPTKKLTYKSDKQTVYLPPSQSDSQADDRPASRWALSVNDGEPLTAEYVCNTGAENPNILKLERPGSLIILPHKPVNPIIDKPDNCVVSVRIESNQGATNKFTNILNPSKEMSYRANNQTIDLPPSQSDSWHNGRPSSRWTISVTGRGPVDWAFICNTGLENPTILEPGGPIFVIGDPKEASKSDNTTKPPEAPRPTEGPKPAESPKPGPTTEPTISIPQVKATYDAEVALEEERINDAKRLATEEEEKKKIQADAEERVRRIQTNATSTAVAYATAVSQPTPKPTPQPTSTPSPSFLDRAVSKSSEAGKKLIDDSLAKGQEGYEYFIDNTFPKITDAVKKFDEDITVKGIELIKPHTEKILLYSTFGLAALWLLRRRARITLWGKTALEKSSQIITPIIKAPSVEPQVFHRAETRTSTQPKTRNPSILQELRQFWGGIRSNGDIDDNADLLLDDTGNMRIPRDREVPLRQISGQALAAVSRGEKATGPLTGEQVDQYDLKELLGYGSFSSVYRAYDSGLRANRAIKILRPEMHGDLALVSQFAYEARILACLDHPNIVKLYGRGMGKHHYIVTELINGKPLHAVYNEKIKPSPAKAIDIISQIAQALDYAHVQGISHNDLHPDNIVLEKEGQIKVIDFGSANHAFWTELKNRHNATAQVYTAPEVLRGVKPSSKSDIYSFGVISFQLITGELPTSSVAKNRQMLEAGLVLPTREVDARAIELILKTLATDESKRPASLSDLAKNLQTFKV